jgi:hypothetical protein
MKNGFSSWWTSEAIEVKYHLTPADTVGLKPSGRRLQSEVARAQAQGQSDAECLRIRKCDGCRGRGHGGVNTLWRTYDRNTR